MPRNAGGGAVCQTTDGNSSVPDIRELVTNYKKSGEKKKDVSTPILDKNPETNTPEARGDHPSNNSIPEYQEESKTQGSVV